MIDDPSRFQLCQSWFACLWRPSWHSHGMGGGARSAPPAAGPHEDGSGRDAHDRLLKSLWSCQTWHMTSKMNLQLGSVVSGDSWMWNIFVSGPGLTGSSLAQDHGEWWPLAMWPMSTILHLANHSTQLINQPPLVSGNNSKAVRGHSWTSASKQARKVGNKEMVRAQALRLLYRSVKLMEKVPGTHW